MKLTDLLKEATLNEVNPRLNKKVKKYLDAYMTGTSPSDPEFHHAVSVILRGALTDANFHSEAKKVDGLFPKAKKAKSYKKSSWEDNLENKGIDISKWAKWDGYDILDAFAFYTNMTIGGGFGNKLSALKESVNESINEASDTYFKSFTTAADSARAMAEKRGFTIDEDDWQTQVALGGKNTRSRPSVGKTTKFTVGLSKNNKPQRKALTFSVYGMESGTFELTAYIN
jgi:hypothetical protein